MNGGIEWGDHPEARQLCVRFRKDKKSSLGAATAAGHLVSILDIQTRRGADRTANALPYKCPVDFRKSIFYVILP